MFGGDNPVSVENAARAVAAFERTLITTNSPYDRWARGETAAIATGHRGQFADLVIGKKAVDRVIRRTRDSLM